MWIFTAAQIFRDSVLLRSRELGTWVLAEGFNSFLGRVFDERWPRYITLKVVTNEKGEASGAVLTIRC